MVEGKNYTHILNIKVGMNIDEAISPENIHGVMYMLGVNNPDDVEKVFLQRKYDEIQTTLGALHFDVLQGEVEPLNQGQAVDTKPETTQEMKPVEPEVEKLPEENGEIAGVTATHIEPNENMEDDGIFMTEPPENLHDDDKIVQDMTDEEQELIGDYFGYLQNHEADDVVAFVVNKSYKDKINEDVVKAFVSGLTVVPFMYKDLGEHVLAGIKYLNKETNKVETIKYDTTL